MYTCHLKYAVLAVCGLIAFSAMLFAQNQVPTPGMTVDLAGFLRTYPILQRSSAAQPPGRLLYPTYTDLRGRITFYGPESFFEKVLRELKTVQNDSVALARLLKVRITRYTKDGTSEVMPDPGTGITIQLPGDEEWLAKTTTEFDCSFRIPVELGPVWSEGRYTLYMGKEYLDGEARRTITAAPQYFEVKKLIKGTGDEINLLSNAWLSSPYYGLVEELIQRKEYTRSQLIDRVLELDPHDAWAKYEKAQWAERFTENEKALRLYKEIIADIRDGKAHRTVALLEPYFSLRPPPVPRTPEGWKQLITQRFIKLVEGGIKRSALAEKEVTELASEKGYEALIGLIKTDKGINLDSSLQFSHSYTPIWIIRHLGRMRAKEAHDILIEELFKLPRVLGLFQREIVNALAQIHGNKKRFKYGPTGEDVEVIEWWLARPKPGDVEQTAQDKIKPQDKEKPKQQPKKSETDKETRGTEERPPEQSVEKTVPDQPEKQQLTEESTWLVPGLIIAGVVIAGLVLLLLLRKK